MPESPHVAVKPRLAYLYSRYPVVSQTFCDSEMLELERMGFAIEVASLNRPPNAFRHERLDRLRAEIHYPPPSPVLDALCATPEFEQKLGPLIRDHGERYGTSYKPEVRARNAWYMARRFRQLGVRHVHVHFANRATHSALFLKKLGFPFSFTAHAQDFMFDLGSTALLAEMAREAEFVVTVSDYSRDLFAEMCPDSDSKTVRIYNGIELDDFPRVQARQRNPLRVVGIGRLIEFKGFQHLIGAAALLRRQEMAVEFRIIGEGRLRSELEARIQREDLNDCVKLLGVRSQEEIKRELADADLFVLPSIVDPVGASDILPTVITEAMACQLPVVSTRVTGIPEMVAHEETGLLVEPGDEPALAAAIARLGADPDTRSRMGAAGRARAERLFALQVTAGVLGNRFAEHYARQPLPSGPQRLDLPIACLLPAWDGAALHPAAPGLADGVRWIACEGGWPRQGGDRATLEALEFFPDASVVESFWLRRVEWRQQLEAARGEMADHLDGAAFYQAARQAVYLAEILPKRGTRHLHARGAEAVATAWMVKQLLPTLSISAAVEEEPGCSRSLLARLLPAFDLVSVSDTRLAAKLPATLAAADHLRLGRTVRRRELRFGPLRLKRSAAPEPVDRAALEAAFFSRLRRLIDNALAS